MFGRNKQKQQPQPASVAAAPAPVQREPQQISGEDFDLLESIAGELRGSLISFDGEVLLDDAEAVYVATMGVPAPVVEIEYPDCLVSLHMEVHRYTPEELGEE